MIPISLQFLDYIHSLLLKEIMYDNFRNLRGESKREKKLKDATKRRKWKRLKY